LKRPDSYGSSPVKKIHQKNLAKETCSPAHQTQKDKRPVHTKMRKESIYRDLIDKDQVPFKKKIETVLQKRPDLLPIGT